MDRYTYRPPQKPGPALALAGGLFALCAALLILLGMKHSLDGFTRTVCAVLAMSGIAVTARFLLPSYIYVLERGRVTVSRVQGKNSIRIAAFSLSDVEGIYDRAEFKTLEAQSGRIKNRRSYCRNLYVRQTVVLVVSGTAGRAVVLLEADKFFSDQLRRYWETWNGML